MTPRPSDNILLDFIKATDLFHTFRQEILQELLVNMEWVCLETGAILFRQGEPGGHLYLLFKGCLHVTITKQDGTEITVAEVDGGKPLGEIQFLSGGTRTANVYAKTHAQLLKFSKLAFDQLAEKNPEILQRLADIIRQRLRRDQLVAMLPNFCGPIDTGMLHTIEAETEWVFLPQGEALFCEGDDGDSFYLLISGRLHAVAHDQIGHERVLAEIRRGEIVGEIAMFTEAPRTASIYAVRNSELVKFSKRAFERIMAAYPNITSYIMRIVIERLQKSQNTVQRANAVMNIAIVPINAQTPIREFTGRLCRQLSPMGNTLCLSSERLDRLLAIEGVAQTPEHSPNNIRIASWLDEQETKYATILYEADYGISSWTRRCIQRADQILIVGQVDSNPALGEIEARLLDKKRAITPARRSLVLLHPDGEQLPSDTHRWLSKRHVENHYHLRWNSEADFGRLARFIRGRSIGVVLGGGGARGLAHIGVLQALEESGIPIDVVGGTSIGGAIAAQYAMGVKPEQMLDLNRKIWIEWKPFSDYTLPVMSLLRGHKFENIAQMVYGNTLIEDLWVNFFCVSTNLTTTDITIHREGSLAKALRATASLPGIAVPLVDGQNLLVDGGVLNNLPGDVMRSLYGGFVIAVNVSSEKNLKIDYEHFPSPWKFLWNRLLPFQQPLQVPNIFDLLMRTTMVSSVQKTHAAKAEVDFYFEPPVNQFKLLEFKALDEIVEVGYQYAKSQIAELQISDILPMDRIFKKY